MGKNTTWPAGTFTEKQLVLTPPFFSTFPASIFLLVPTSKKDLALPFEKLETDVTWISNFKFQNQFSRCVS